ncbi:7TM chemoreceptor, partial [Teladorsagia circumcincta]
YIESNSISHPMIVCDDFDIGSDFYQNLMQVLSFVAVAFNAFAIYCIFYKSPKQMGAYKWYLLIYQLSSTLFDFVYMFFTLPVIFFPVPMGYPASWIAQWLSISGHTAVALVVTTCLCLVASIVMLFVYRCHVIIPAHHVLKVNDNGLGNFALALLGTHGCVESVTLIMCNEPYRTFVGIVEGDRSFPILLSVVQR